MNNLAQRISDLFQKPQQGMQQPDMMPQMPMQMQQPMQLDPYGQQQNGLAQALMKGIGYGKP